jgi:hypothetical protein
MKIGRGFTGCLFLFLLVNPLFPQSGYRDWLASQRNSGLTVYRKFEATIETFLRLRFESMVRENIQDFQFLFDVKNPESLQDYAYERNLLSVLLARGMDYGIHLESFELTPQYRKLYFMDSEAGGMVKSDSRVFYTHEPGKIVSRIGPWYEFEMILREGLWLIRRMGGNGAEHSRYPRGTDFKKVISNIASEIEIRVQESSYLKSIKRQLRSGNPRARERGYESYLNVGDLAMTLQEVKRFYPQFGIVRIFHYDNRYALVESRRPGYVNDFRLFDLKTEENIRASPMHLNCTLAEIKEPHWFIFYADGTNNYNSDKDFPSVIDSFRVEPGPFHHEEKPRYYRITEKASFGGRPKGMLLDLKVTMDGLEMAFGPQPGHEGFFAAAYSDIPRTDILGIDGSGRFVIRFADTHLKAGLPARPLGENRFIQAVELEEKNGSCLVLLTLTERAAAYTGEKTRDPFARFIFVGEEFLDSMKYRQAVEGLF